MADLKFYNISSANIRVNVFFDNKMNDLIGAGTVNKVCMGSDGHIHIETIMMDSGELCNGAGLTVVPIEEE